MEPLHPDVELHQVGQHLGTGHELPEPGPAVVAGGGEQALPQGPGVHQGVKGGRRVIQNGGQPGAHQLFVEGIVGLGIGGLGPCAHVLGQQPLRRVP